MNIEEFTVKMEDSGARTTGKALLSFSVKELEDILWWLPTMQNENPLLRGELEAIGIALEVILDKKLRIQGRRLRSFRYKKFR